MRPWHAAVLVVVLSGTFALILASVVSAESQTFHGQSYTVHIEYPSTTIPAGERFFVSVTAQATSGVNPTVTSWTNASMDTIGCSKVGFALNAASDAGKSARWTVEMGNATNVCAFDVATTLTGGQVRSTGAVQAAHVEMTKQGTDFAGRALWFLWLVYAAVVMLLRPLPVRLVGAVVGLSVLLTPLDPLQFAIFAVGQASIVVTVVVQILGSRDARRAS